MNKSSNGENKDVNVNLKEAQKLLAVLPPDFREIIRQGVDEHIADGIKLIRELLMLAEAQARSGSWYSRKEGTADLRWGSEKGTGIVFGQKTAVRRPRLRNGAEVQLETYKAMNNSSLHFLEGDEIRALRKLRRSYPDSAFVFCSERQGPLSLNEVHKLVVRAGKLANLELSVHPHMLRHGKGYQLASKGVDTRAIQAYLGHKNIQHTVLYTKLDPARFKGFGKDIKL